MDVLKRILGKFVKGSGREGSPRPPVSRGATLGKIWQKIGLPVTGICPGRSVWHPFISAAPRTRRVSARPVTEHNIGGAHPRALSPRRWETPSGMSPQTGRSMIEMLAVLAIIGILSVVAVAGLMWAFAKHKANDTMHDISVWTFAALDSNQLYDMSSGQLVLPELGAVSTHGYPMALIIESDEVFAVHVNDVPKRVCSLMLDMVTDNQIVTVNDVLFEKTDICTHETNLMIFYLSKYQGVIDQTCIPACSGGERCCGGECRTITTPCGSDGCTDCGSDYCTNSNTCCDNPNATKCGSNDCCEGNCCNGTCCPAGQVCGNDGNCACPNGTTWHEETGKCRCPNGYILVDGMCQSFYCNGEGDSCFIDGLLCGTRCTNTDNADAVTCAIGICRADICENESAFGYGSFSKTPYGMAGSWHWGCKIPPRYGLGNCYWRGGTFFCFESDTLTGKETRCCMTGYTKDLSVRHGVCDLNICTQAGADYYKFAYHGGCTWNEAGVWCYPVYDGEAVSYWVCSNGGGTCSEHCSNPPGCDGACDTVECPTGTTYDTEQKMCCDDAVCCRMEMPIKCYRNGQRCANGCSDFAQTCHDGNCYNPGCDTSDGFIYTYNSVHDLYGCFQEKTGIFCRRDKAKAGAIQCTVNRQMCGTQCSYNGVCELPTLEVCAPDYGTSGKKKCPYNAPVTQTCICDTNESADVGTYCCPAGHTASATGCTLLTCPDGEILNENGECQPIE